MLVPSTGHASIESILSTLHLSELFLSWSLAMRPCGWSGWSQSPQPSPCPKSLASAKSRGPHCATRQMSLAKVTSISCGAHCKSHSMSPRKCNCLGSAQGKGRLSSSRMPSLTQNINAVSTRYRVTLQVRGKIWRDWIGIEGVCGWIWHAKAIGTRKDRKDTRMAPSKSCTPMLAWKHEAHEKHVYCYWTNPSQSRLADKIRSQYSTTKIPFERNYCLWPWQHGVLRACARTYLH